MHMHYKTTPSVEQQQLSFGKMCGAAIINLCHWALKLSQGSPAISQSQVCSAALRRSMCVCVRVCICILSSQLRRNPILDYCGLFVMVCQMVPGL